MTSIIRRSPAIGGKERHGYFLSSNLAGITLANKLFTREFFERNFPITAAAFKLWISAAWTTGKTVKVYNGTGWDTKPLKIKSGTWIMPN